jgi:D-amino-acid dehydrogenase
MSPDDNPAITVVGAGIVGICCALSLLEKGVTVRIIDRDPPARGASQGNAGVVSPWSCVPQSLPGVWRSVPKWLLDPEGPVAIRWGYLFKALPWAIRFLRAGRADRIAAAADAMLALNRPNVELYRHHLADTGHEDLLRDAFYVHVYRKAATADLGDLAWRLRSERGAPIELIDGDALREVEPALSMDYQAAILIKDTARAVSPGRLGEVLAEKARRMGAEFMQTVVHRLLPDNDSGWRLDTDRGELAAENVVLAAGAWSARLLKPLGITVPLEAERGYHLVFRNPGVTLDHLIMEVERKFVASSMEAGLRSAGTAEFAGLDAEPNYRRARIFKRLSKRMLPGLNTEDAEEWMGTRPSFPDSLPCIGELPGQRNLLAAFGHSHYGLGMAPMTGRIVAGLVAGAPPDIDLAPYRIDRFN